MIALRAGRSDTMMILSGITRQARSVERTSVLRVARPREQMLGGVEVRRYRCLLTAEDEWAER